MTTLEKFNILKEQGLSLKFVGNLINIPENAMYKWHVNRQKFNEDRLDKIDKIINSLYDLYLDCEKAKDLNKYEDLTNQKFNHLTALYPVGPNKKGAMQWACKCDCGNPILRITTGFSLKNGETVSCGCQRAQYGGKNYTDLTGQRFGKLTVISKSKSKNNRAYWKCKCDCGTIKDICGHDLIQGKIKSCGCINYSIGEKNIENILKENNIKYIKEYTFLDLLSPKNYLLRFDFAIFSSDNKLIKLIEFDGIQHNEINHFNGNIDEYNYRKICDKLKDDYCKKHQIPLVRISYEKRDSLTKEDLL